MHKTGQECTKPGDASVQRNVNVERQSVPITRSLLDRFPEFVKVERSLLEVVIKRAHGLITRPMKTM